MRHFYSWNPVYTLVMKIKDEYSNLTGEIDEYDLEKWINTLNKQEYNDIFSCLQFTKSGKLVLIRYGLQEMQEGMWIDPNSIYRECRSIVIDLRTENIVLCPFRKFFNLNEVIENTIDVVRDKIKNAKSIEITNKLDGSMQSARWYDNEVFLSGSQAIDPNNSWRLQDGYSKLTDNHKLMIKENEKFTFIFEYISLKDAHVVKYKKEDEGMYLIGMRNVYDGRELSYNDVKDYSNKYNVPMTQIENRTFDEILNDSSNLTSDEKEGWVINIDGHRIKLKCDDYVKLHRLLDYLSSVNVIIKSIADNTYDDLISKVPEIYKPRVNKIAEQVFEYKRKLNEEINRFYNAAPKNDIKTFMIWVDNNCRAEVRGYVKSLFLGKEFNLLKSIKLGNYKKASEIGITKEELE